MFYRSTINGYIICELDKQECEHNFKQFPTYVCYKKDDHKHIGLLSYTEYERSSYVQMGIWCLNN